MFAVLLVAPPPPPIVIGRGMAGVELRMTEAEVEARLGSPLRRRGGQLHFRLVDVTVGARTGRVVRISTRSRLLRTSQGFGVGTRVRAIQGLPGLFCDLEPGGGSCTTGRTHFFFAHDRITRVVIG
jgi:hypothetical protein